MNTIGERLTALLKEQRRTQKQLADLIGVTEATVSRYITGERTPKSGILANMATALHTTSDYLLGQEPEGDLEHDFPVIQRLIARNASKMNTTQKRELMNALFPEE